MDPIETTWTATGDVIGNLKEINAKMNQLSGSGSKQSSCSITDGSFSVDGKQFSLTTENAHRFAGAEFSCINIFMTREPSEKEAYAIAYLHSRIRYISKGWNVSEDQLITPPQPDETDLT